MNLIVPEISHGVTTCVALTVCRCPVKFLRLAVPGALKKGEPADLTCEYDLEGETLYSVKWYKNNVEILRYIPSDAPASPPLQVFDLVGVHINIQKSNESYIHLNKTDMNTGGVYGCEVSTDAPQFKTVRAEKEIRIYGRSDITPGLPRDMFLMFK
ncbi:hypothetical protein LAZ67_15000229 [Cordylochernes scorpioides]|uniref:Ig-like domain-containing protein n=1 Tax=Cordylochernes scorpioides TaxID=51811 RepID=A0ABY6L7Y0_9ARAC|nr:hypothetical protein LAZ67_15000229 [Cordylochernes scorpioides]